MKKDTEKNRCLFLSILHLDFHDDRQNHRTALGLLEQVITYIALDGRFQAVPVTQVLYRAAVERHLRNGTQLLHESLGFLDVNEAARYPDPQ